MSSQVFLKVLLENAKDVCFNKYQQTLSIKHFINTNFYYKKHENLELRTFSLNEVIKTIFRIYKNIGWCTLQCYIKKYEYFIYNGYEYLICIYLYINNVYLIEGKTFKDINITKPAKEKFDELTFCD